MNNKNGVLLVISGPSGVGKGTVCKFLSENEKDIFLSISATSRKPRDGEIEGVHYYYKTPKEFDDMIKNDEFLEYANYITSSYGTPIKPVNEHLKKGHNVILEIEVQGGTKIKEKFPEAVLIFMLPPSMEILKERLTGRNTETQDVIEKRIKRAYEEFEFLDKYDYLIVNDTVENAADEIKSVIKAEQHKTKRISQKIKEELELL